MSRGRRYDDTPKLNIKKVIATVVAIIVVIMFVISIKNLLSGTKKTTKDVSAVETYFPVYLDGKWGAIDNNGNLVVNAMYDEIVAIPDPNKDIFVCTYDIDYSTGTYSTKVINKVGNEVLTDYNNVQAIENSNDNGIWYEKDILKFEKDGKYGLIDFNGKLILEAEYDSIYALDGIEKNIIIEKDGLKGLVNTSMGEVIIEPNYTDITTLLKNSYESGYIVQKDGKYGVITADKKTVFEPIYDEIKNVTSDGYYAVVENGKLELVDKTGIVKLDSGFDSIEEINGETITIISNGKYGALSVDGIEVVSSEYEDLKYIYGTYYIAKKDGNYGVISTTGEVVVDYEYVSMEYQKTADFIQADNESYKTDLIDRNFNVVLNDVIISELNLENGYLRVREGDEYNYYNFKFEKKTSQEVLATNTLFLVKENGKYGYENKNGERIVDCIYDDAREQNKFGYCAVKKDGVWGCLKSDGTVVLDPSVNLEENLYVDFINTWYLDKDLELNVYTK